MIVYILFINGIPYSETFEHYDTAVFYGLLSEQDYKIVETTLCTEEVEIQQHGKSIEVICGCDENTLEVTYDELEITDETGWNCVCTIPYVTSCEVNGIKIDDLPFSDEKKKQFFSSLSCIEFELDNDNEL